MLSNTNSKISLTVYLFIVLALLMNPTSCVTWSSTLSCETCSVPCRFTSCYRIKGEDYDQQICGDSACSLVKNVTIPFGNCTYDLYGKNCPTGACISLPLSGCANVIQPYISCPNSFSYEISCGTCTNSNLLSCGNCKI